MCTYNSWEVLFYLKKVKWPPPRSYQKKKKILYTPKLLSSKINTFEIRAGKNIEPPSPRKKSRHVPDCNLTNPSGLFFQVERFSETLEV